MNTRIVSHALAAAGVAAAFIIGSQIAAKGASSSALDQKWTANGASACERFLTPELVAAIQTTAAGAAVKDNATSCHRGEIYLILKIADVAVFKQEMPRIVMAHPMTGIGDAAFWNDASAMSSVKAPDRGCDMSVIGAPAKISGEELGRKLGEICNKIFALP